MGAVIGAPEVGKCDFGEIPNRIKNKDEDLFYSSSK